MIDIRVGPHRPSIGAWVCTGIPMNFLLQIEIARRSQRTNHDIRAHAAIGRYVTAGISEFSIGAIVVHCETDLAASGCHDVARLRVSRRGESACQQRGQKDEQSLQSQSIHKEHVECRF
jgi:hypothetical protein